MDPSVRTWEPPVRRPVTATGGRGTGPLVFGHASPLAQVQVHCNVPPAVDLLAPHAPWTRRAPHKRDAHLDVVGDESRR